MAINTPKLGGVSARVTVKDAVAIEQGSMVCLQTADGEAVKAADAATVENVIGVNVTKDVSADDTNRLIVVNGGVYRFANSSTNAVAKANIGSSVYVEDEKTVSTDSGSNSIVAGTVVDVDTNGVWIKIG